MDENKSKSVDFWMIRPCDVYNQEYNQCTSILSRLHQMFIFGSTTDCNYRHEDYTNCLKWKNYKDTKAAEILINSEQNKRMLRWKSYYDNNVWENRDQPPENWNVPLPDFIAQRRSDSTLKDSLEDYSIEENNKSMCSIM
ncbi:Hypothetical protein CINCED_3A008160 [Cinara cedri]|uniref:Synaptic plasticity regulator PANTS n=1 Tax=Cinara cedri TaxID=506608 RepID=A0A5E4N6R5_9HEMI|nr:Hypothetical protein CINCED_3A008160 [Cinara cedri]